jgi:hypothetical protein
MTSTGGEGGGGVLVACKGVGSSVLRSYAANGVRHDSVCCTNGTGVDYERLLTVFVVGCPV